MEPLAPATLLLAMAVQQPTAAQLRSAIDHGRAWDKVGAPDPAAVPLGTDAEAAGTPDSAEEISAAMREEIHERPALSPDSGLRPLAVGIVVAIVAVACLGLLLWAMPG